MNLSTLFQAIRAIRAAEAQEHKQRDFEALIAKPLNYAIIQDLINSASAGVVIEATLATGDKLVIRKEDPYDRARLDLAVNRDFVGGL
jgi:hypothetical protein